MSKKISQKAKKVVSFLGLTFPDNYDPTCKFENPHSFNERKRKFCPDLEHDFFDQEDGIPRAKKCKNLENIDFQISQDKIPRPLCNARQSKDTSCLSKNCDVMNINFLIDKIEFENAEEIIVEDMGWVN